MKVRLPEGAARAPPRKRQRRRASEILRCPTCGSTSIVPELAFIAGARYFCKDCGFRGALAVTGMPPREGPAPSKEAPR